MSDSIYTVCAIRKRSSFLSYCGLEDKIERKADRCSFVILEMVEEVDDDAVVLSHEITTFSGIVSSLVSTFFILHYILFDF